MVTVKSLLDAWKLLQKILPFAKKKAEKQYLAYSALRGVDLATKDGSYDILYFEALYQFEHNLVKHPLLVTLFREESAKKAFEYDLTKHTEDRFLLDLQANLAVKEEYVPIRPASIDLVKEVDEFIQIFKSLVQQRRTPHEKELMHYVKSIYESLTVPSDMLDLSEHIKDLGKLREENKHDAVLTLLQTYKRDKWATISNELKHKITVNLGVTLFELGRKKDAARYFIELPQFHIKPEESYALTALGYALLGEGRPAFEYADKAIALNRRNENAYLAKLFIKDAPITAEEIDGIVPKDMQQVPIIAINIATSLEKSGKLDEAFEIFSRLEQEYVEMDSFRCDILTQIAVNRIHSLSKKENYQFDQLSESSKIKLNQALGYLTTVWDYFKHTDLNKSRAYVLANRGVVYKSLGQRDKAERDFLDSLNLNKTYFAYSNLLELYSNDIEKAVNILRELKELELTEEQRQEVILMDAIQHYLEGDINVAISGLSIAFPEVKDAERKRKYITVLVGFLLECRQYQMASHYAQELINSDPNDPLGYFLRSNLANGQGDHENSSTYLQKAVSLSTEETANSTLWDIANALLSQEDYKNAATVLGKAADLEVFSKFTQNLIIAEFKSGNYRDAHSLADKLLQTYPLNPVLTEIKASILEGTDQFVDAEAVIRKFLEANPDNVFFRVKLVMNLYKSSQYIRGIEELDKIGKYDSIPVDYQFLIADAYIQGGEATKGLEIGYRLRMQHYGEEWIHQRFSQLQMRLTHLSHATYFPQTAGIDCYVSLKNNNGKILEYIIVNQVQYPLEIRINEPMAQELLGKQVGDTFVRNNFTYEVTSIKWKYTYALHDSLDQIQNRFNNDGPMRVFEFEPGTTPLEMISQMLNPMKGGQAFARSLDDLYMKGQSTVGVNANRLGVSAVKYWSRLVALPNMGVLTIGTKDELIRAMKLIEEGKSLVFDMVALLTLQQSNGFSILEQLENDKYVAQSTIDEIEAELEEVRNRKDVEDLNLLEVNDQLTRQIVTVEEKAKIIENLTLFLENIKNTTKRTQPPLPADFNEKSELDRVIGKSFHDSLLIAKDHNALLLSDDRTFRVIAHNDFGVLGLPCLGLVQYLARQNGILLEKADAIHESLVRSNYRHIPMRPELLMRICQKDNFRISQAFTRACDCLEPMIMDDERTAAFVSIFFRMLSLQVNLSTTRDSIILFVLNILYKNRDKSKVKSLLIQYLERQFILLPIQKKEILDIIGIL